MNIELRYKEYQPFIIDTLKWGRITEDVYYARFQLKEHKYIHYTHHYEYTNNKKYFVLSCSPIIYTSDFKQLREVNLDEYYLHEDYWQASIAFEYPDEVFNFDSFSINALKWEYELWFINIDKDVFFNKYDNMPAVNISVSTKD